MKNLISIINTSKKGSNSINCTQIGKDSVTNSSDTANEFNRHFTSVAKQTEEKIIKRRQQYCKYLKNPNDNFFFIAPSNNKEVLSEIKIPKNKKSLGPFSICIKFLKLFQTVLGKRISLIVN